MLIKIKNITGQVQVRLEKLRVPWLINWIVDIYKIKIHVFELVY